MVFAYTQVVPCKCSQQCAAPMQEILLDDVEFQKMQSSGNASTYRYVQVRTGM
jgi:hypothetical protein